LDLADGSRAVELDFLMMGEKRRGKSDGGKGGLEDRMGCRVILANFGIEFL
jgi:hypothetical protein